MICPNCESEFREGFTVCSDCGVALVESLDQVIESGVESVVEVSGGAELEPLHETRNPEELGELLERLEEARVPYVTQAGTAIPLLDGHELSEPGEPEAWEARIYVSAPFHARAKQMLSELRIERAAGAAARRAAAASGNPS